MTASAFSTLFIFLLSATTLSRLWLSMRQINHVKKHQKSVPELFRTQISLSNHQKAAAYTCAKTYLDMFSTVFHALVLLAFTLGGGIELIVAFFTPVIENPLLLGAIIIGCVMLISSILDTPFNLYQTFVIEQRFGFNKTTLTLYLQDAFKSLVVGLALGLPLLFCVLWLMEKMHDYWWLYVWLVWMAFNLFILLVFPTYIAPLFNKFTPLEEGDTRQHIEKLLTQCGFKSQGLFVMDGSKRSAHGNAYFTGFGNSKRIVFFDTLLEKLTLNEVKAVLAHELGHFRHKHVIKRMIGIFLLSLAFLYLLSLLLKTDWFFLGLGVSQNSTAIGLLLFTLTLPLLSFWINPLMSASSRKHEFEADSYAADQTAASDLISALIKLYQDNASTLTPDPFYSSFYDSHPPAIIRVKHLLKLIDRQEIA